ncbi:MAG: L-lactate permease [Salinisphaera sp.]|nr:L-lactate permease [Salinisphaera sp.]
MSGLPIVLALGCMAARMTAAKAGALALAAAVIIALVAFSTSLSQLLGAEADLAGVMIEVALILFGGLWLNAILQHAGSQARLGRALIERTCRPERASVLVVLGIIPFAESVTGFGVGAIIGIPLLRAIGLSPGRAAICGLLGLVIVPWGSLGPGTLVAARLANVDYQALGTMSALLSGVVFFVMGAAALLIGLGRSALRTALVDLLRTAISLWLGVWLAYWAVPSRLRSR